MDDRDPSPLTRLLITALSMTLTWWLMQPEHRRRELKMRLALAAQTRLQRLARKVAGRAMLQELRDPQAYEDGRITGYDIARDLMTGPVERAHRWYEDQRGTS